MKIIDVLAQQGDVRKFIEDLMDPSTLRAPTEKGPNAIRVTGYIVHGHWRRRWQGLKGTTTNNARGRRRRAIEEESHGG